MSTRVLWDESKREANLDKHGLDFCDAVMVLESPYRLDVEAVRGGERRTQSFAYVFDVLAVLTVVHVARQNARRIVSFRAASEVERSAYYGWLEDDFNGKQ
ncbi:MAG: BrnT family toxin [Sterolibacteriaceae bacterium]|uniref:BrnT family toxin n=1 Tax=Candidatus Methylophosphatis roskildensis TaxID=2899263 RepID=A0A9D7HKA9_9PROT|nr:BrnT family toxin [Candidatus Methylophosphatis roskildensis]MBK7237741.1 BrnT family toxin [Sterolibacteriaceae bacterium]